MVCPVTKLDIQDKYIRKGKFSDTRDTRVLCYLQEKFMFRLRFLVFLKLRVSSKVGKPLSRK